MDKINQKLNKYRVKLINAKTSDKMDFYNLKMQQYLIMQKNLLKTGGYGTEMFGYINNDLQAYSVDKNNEPVVEPVNASENKKPVVEPVNASENKEPMQEPVNASENKEPVQEPVNASKNKEPYANIHDANEALRSIENIVIDYYVSQIKDIGDDKDKIDYIVSEFNIFEESTVERIQKKLVEQNITIPEKIKNCLNNKCKEPTTTQVDQAKSIITGGSRARKIYREYF